MSSASRTRSILVSTRPGVLAVAAVTLLTACGQSGPLYIPQTPAAAHRATLPQTMWGGHATPPAAGSSGAASAPTPFVAPPPLLPDVTETE